ncbi:hypothetical protein ACFLR3_01695 [Campylobacterota bacterium]
MSYELILFILFISAELFEMIWQKSPTLLEMLEKIYGYYNKSPYLLYLMHPSYILGIYIYYLSSYNSWVLAILIIKSIDIVFKVQLIHKHFVLDELDHQMKAMLNMHLHPIMLTMGLMLYPYLLYLALF